MIRNYSDQNLPFRKCQPEKRLPKILGDLFTVGKGSKKFYNKCSENSRSQVVFWTDIFAKNDVGAPGIIRDLRERIFGRSTSTGNEAFCFLICLDANKFVLLGVFTFTKGICRNIRAQPLLKNAKTTSGRLALLKNVFAYWSSLLLG